MKNTNREHTYFFCNKPIKDGLRKVASHNNTTISKLLEDGAREIIKRHSLEIQNERRNLESINSLFGR